MKFLNLSIFQKILVTMLFVAVVPLSAIWYINYQNTIQQTTDGVNKQLADVSDKLVSYVSNWVAMNLKVLNQNGALADITSMDGARQKPVLKSILDEYKWSYLVFTTGADGMNIGRSDGGPGARDTSTGTSGRGSRIHSRDRKRFRDISDALHRVPRQSRCRTRAVSRGYPRDDAGANLRIAHDRIDAGAELGAQRRAEEGAGGVHGRPAAGQRAGR